MNKSEGIRCAKCGHILSLDELERRQCNKCKNPMDEPASTSFEERLANKRAWIDKWKDYYFKDHVSRESSESENHKEKRLFGARFTLGILIGAGLIAIGTVAFLFKLRVLSGSLWGFIWPIILITIGLMFILGRRN